MKLQGEGESLGLAKVEMGGDDGGRNVAGRKHLDPCRQHGMGVQKFGRDRGRDDDLTEKQVEKVGPTDRQERRERGGVADDDHELAGAEFFDGDEVFGEIFDAVVEGNLSPTQLAHEFALADPGGFGGLAERDFPRGEEADGEVQRGLAGRERRFERLGQGDVHGGGTVSRGAESRNIAKGKEDGALFRMPLLARGAAARMRVFTGKRRLIWL